MELTELLQQGVDRIDLKWNLLLCQWLDEDPAVPVEGEENPSLPVLNEGSSCCDSRSSSHA